MTFDEALEECKKINPKARETVEQAERLAEEMRLAEEASRIKPCPFCGGDSLLRERHEWTERMCLGSLPRPYYRRECRECKATFANWYRSIRKADAAWNRRISTECSVGCGICLAHNGMKRPRMEGET